MNWFCQCRNPECDWIHNNHELGLWNLNREWNRRETMTIPKAALDKLCSCEEMNCEKPHTLQELEAEMSETEFAALMDQDGASITVPPCPTCGKSDQVTTYVYKNDVEAYCSRTGCYTNFDVKTGKVIDWQAEDDSDTDFSTEVTVDTSPKKHQMHMDGNEIWVCDGCTFETQFLSEVRQHENNMSLTGIVEAKPEKHEMFQVLVKDGPNIWACKNCDLKTTDTLDVKVHENSPTDTQDPHYVNFKAQDLYMCKYCKKEFTTFKEGLTHENDAGKKLNRFTGGGYTTYQHCVHKPKHVIDGGDEGWGVWAGRKVDCQDSLEKFDVVLNLSGSSVGRKHNIPFPELKQWESESGIQEMSLDWPDRGVVQLPKQFWKALIELLRKNKWKMVVFCIGGHGRTGTAVASMFVTEFGWEPKEACSWVWDNYCKEAIETDSQINYVYGLAGKKYVPPKEEKKESIVKAETSLF